MDNNEFLHTAYVCIELADYQKMVMQTLACLAQISESWLIILKLSKEAIGVRLLYAMVAYQANQNLSL